MKKFLTPRYAQISFAVAGFVAGVSSFALAAQPAVSAGSSRIEPEVVAPPAPPINPGIGPQREEPVSFESIGMRQARAQNSGDVSAVSSPALGRETLGAVLANEHTASEALGGTTMTTTIREATAEGRDKLASDLTQRLDASSRFFGVVKAQATSANSSEFQAAVQDVENRDRLLREKLRSAQQDSTDTWSNTRASLASDYEALARAMDRAESLGASRQ